MNTPANIELALQKRIREAREAFIRWHEVSLKQLGHVVNLVLTLTTASVGFAINLIVEGKISPASPGGCVFFISLLVLFGAIFLGLLTNCARLLNFRYTARSARRRELRKRLLAGEPLTIKQKQKTEKQTKYSSRADWLGCCTWYLLFAQLFLFFGGIGLLGWSVWLHYWKS